ncbi:MAG: D-tyrosyl-tRNA(Tyr) deacylase [Chlamydiia bacterium]|nr:D-tyrosyl-tRNA(Tyr) deacylase [Chlamydiia bacterium]
MKVLIQRVKEARVTVSEKVVGEIAQGLLLFFGVHREDGPEKISWLAEKVVGLRIFEDEAGKMNRSVQDVRGKLLVVSQFTLYGDCEGGRRPSFTQTMPGDRALPFYETFVEKLQEKIGRENVATGSFGAEMQVHLVNDGPVTFILSR